MPTTVDLIIDALETLGGIAHADDIAKVVMASSAPIKGQTPENTIRARLQEHCRESTQFREPELFESVYGLKARKGVWKLISSHLNPTNPDVVFDGADAFETEEGRAVLRTHLRRERSRKLILEFKRRLPEARCEACCINFSEVYGKYGADYIEAHHKIPVANLQVGEKTRIDDLAPLCANCHRVIHKNPDMTVDELRQILAKTPNVEVQQISWSEAVKLAILRLVERSQTKGFNRQQLIDEEMSNIVRDTKSVGMTPSQTLSRVLQELRDEGTIAFTDEAGSYKVLI